jgi:hypothetical protein
VKFKRCLVLGLHTEIIILCLIAAYRFVDLPSTFMLLIFTIFFASLTYHLDGSFNTKIGLLAIGNITGLLWNFTFNFFENSGTQFFGKVFDNVYLIFYPFLNSLWIVSFWSLSLAVLPKKGLRTEGRKIDY